ncbi:hypothetical protein ACQBAU_02190 [Propionibacteriaceae bacterium Y2011]
MMWSYLIHLGVNMWSDREEPLPGEPSLPGVTFRTTRLATHKAVWDEVTHELAKAGFTHLVIDLGEAIRYESHPELAVDGAWSTDQLRTELARLRELGLTPIPKLNFSASHDTWLGPYGRQLSTPVYYEVVADLIAEVAELFDSPEYFHLGMDEETDGHQQRYQYAVIRRRELWWHDLEFMLDCTRKAGARPWVWSDAAWHHPEDYYTKMPKDVLQSNWYYGLWFGGNELDRPRVLNREYHLAYLDLEDHGYDQVPTGSSWHNAWDNLDLTVDYCQERVAPERLLGFMQAPWVMTTANDLDTHLRTIEMGARTIARINGDTTSA